MPWRDCDAREIRHLVGLYLEFVAAEGAGARPEHKVENIFRVHCQAAQLGAVVLAGPGDRARLATIAVESKAAQFGGRNVDWIPLQDYRGLCGVAAIEDGGRRGALTKSTEDVRL